MTLGNREPQPQRIDIPGETDERVLVLAGVHGSELAAVEVVRRLVAGLRNGPPPAVCATIVPILFCANHDVAARALAARIHRAGRAALWALPDSEEGRWSAGSAVDPNRNFPPVCSAPRQSGGRDARGRAIERENLFLIDLIAQLAPTRIVSVHSMLVERDRPPTPTDRGARNLPGIFVDPKTALPVAAVLCDPQTLPEVGADDERALGAARFVANRQQELIARGEIAPARFGNRLDDWVCGNWLDTDQPTARYPDLGPEEEGVSLGQWASRAVKGAPGESREAITVFTVEVRRHYPSSARGPLAGATGSQNPGPPSDAQLRGEHRERALELQAHADAIQQVMLAAT